MGDKESQYKNSLDMIQSCGSKYSHKQHQSVEVNLREMLELRRGINTKQYSDETLNNRDEKILN